MRNYFEKIDTKEYKGIDIFSKDSQFDKQKDIMSICLFKSTIDSPFITIAIPTYNRTSTLKDAIDSALYQNEPNCIYDIVVVDDCPKRQDNTELFMEQYRGTIVSYYKNQKNLNQAGNWNKMYSLARGKYVVMLHDDDMLHCKYLQIVSSILSLNDSIDFLYFDNVFFSEKPPITPSTIKTNLTPIKIALSDMFTHDPVHIAGNVLKRESVIELGGFQKDMEPNHDHAFWAKITYFKNSYYVPVPLAYYRIGINCSTCPELMNKMEHALTHVSVSILKKLNIPRVITNIIQLSVNKNQVLATRKLFINDYESNYFEPITTLEYHLSTKLAFWVKKLLKFKGK